MRLIDADDLVNKIVFYTKIPIPYKERVEDAIQDMPTVDAVEVVRCKDCKYSDENWRRVSVRWLPCMDVRTGSNWFCGSAERKDGEADD